MERGVQRGLVGDAFGDLGSRNGAQPGGGGGREPAEREKQPVRDLRPCTRKSVKESRDADRDPIRSEAERQWKLEELPIQQVGASATEAIFTLNAPATIDNSLQKGLQQQLRTRFLIIEALQPSSIASPPWP